DAAETWAALLNAGGDDQSKARLAALRPLLRIAGIDQSQPISGAALDAWNAGLAGLPAPIVGRRREIAYSLLAAFGDSLPVAAWLPLFDGPMMIAASTPRPALWQGLRL